MLNKFTIDDIITKALKEDISLGDITTDNLIDEGAASQALYIAKENGIIAGLSISERVFKLLNPDIEFSAGLKDGEGVKHGDIIAKIQGPTRDLLKGERTALNFLQRLSGIATITAEFCARVKDLPVRIVDTRKTTPGLRMLEKYAVRMGGGHNHRFCLSDGVLIKDNHIKAAGGVGSAIEKARICIPHTVKIEIETETMEQVQEALDHKADIIMLDNMSLDMMAEAVRIINKHALVEASGNVRLDTVYDIAKTGVDIISVGSITHSAKALDISMRIV